MIINKNKMVLGHRNTNNKTRGRWFYFMMAERAEKMGVSAKVLEGYRFLHRIANYG
jgi:hypothetical protein